MRTLGTQLRVTLATGGITLVAQGIEAGWLLLAVAVFAPRTTEEQDA